MKRKERKKTSPLAITCGFVLSSPLRPLLLAPRIPFSSSSTRFGWVIWFFSFDSGLCEIHKKGFPTVSFDTTFKQKAQHTKHYIKKESALARLCSLQQQLCTGHTHTKKRAALSKVKCRVHRSSKRKMRKNNKKGLPSSYFSTGSSSSFSFVICLVNFLFF